LSEVLARIEVVPALPPVPSVLSIVLQYSIGADPLSITRLHYKFTGTPPVAADLNTFASGVFAAWQNNQALSTHPTVTLKEVVVTDLTSATGAQGIHTGTAAGTAGGGQLPASAAVLVNYKVNRRYRGGKPRTYWPMGTDTDLNNPQTWLPASITNFNQRVQGFNSAVSALTWAGASISFPANVSYFQGFTVVTDPVTGRSRNIPKLRTSPVVDQISAIVVNATVGSQRRRLRATGA